MATAQPVVPQLDASEGVAAIAERRDETGGDGPAAPPPGEGEAPNWPDETSESAFLAEARERGEPVAPPKPRDEAAEESEAKPLPPLDDLVQRIPAEVRDVLDDLFRARFVSVKRVPKHALK